MTVKVKGLDYSSSYINLSFIVKESFEWELFTSKGFYDYLFFGRILMMIRWYLVRAGEPLSVTATIK